MKLFSFGGNKEKITLILDIQSSVVRGALVRGIEKGTPSILHSCIIHVPYRANSGSSYLIKKTVSSVSEVFDDAFRYISTLDKKVFADKLDSVHFALSSPWITSIARVVSIEEDSEVNIDKKLIQKIINTEREKIATDANILSVIEEKVFDVRLNGYSISDWEDKDAKDIEISYTSSYASQNVIDKLRDCCHHRISKSRIYFHSSLLLQYLGLQNIYDNTQNYCIVYLHGELTDTVVVRRGFPVFFGSFPFGVQTLIRKLAKNAKVEEGTAESMLSILTNNHADMANFESNQKIINEVNSGWQDQLKKILSSEIDTEILESDFIVSSRTHEDFFISSVRQIFTKARVQSLSSDLVQSKVPFSNDSDHIRLLALYASALTSVKTIKEDKSLIK